VSCRLKILVTLLLSLSAAPSLGATLVTACGTDTAPGSMNLTTALATGGEIKIQCAGTPNEIHFTAAHTVAVTTHIDGGNVTLVGTGNGAMFVLPTAQPLTLSNLSIRNPPSNPADPGIFTGIVYDASDTANVELSHVQVSDTRLPLAVRRLVARDSTFSNNGDANNADFGVVMAGELVLENVTFRDNLSRPFHALWRGDPIAKKEAITARVVNCIFERNQRAAFWAVGDLTIQGSTFTDNGAAVPYKASGRGALYGGAVFLELADGMAGAVELILGRATISRSTFKGNHGMLGGAVLAWRSALTLQSTDLDDNKAVSGGAVAYLSPAGSNPQMPRLRLGHLKMHRNVADKDGGAFMVLGDVSGDAVLLRANKAGETGSAIAVVSPGVSPAEAVPAALAAKLPTPGGAPPSRIEVSRLFVLDNTAAQDAIATGDGIVRFGNGLFARNESTAAGGAAIHGQKIELANSTLVGNKSNGLRIEAGGGPYVRIANTILAGNTNNCTAPLGGSEISGANLQSPGTACGATITSADPSLNSRFAPSLTSPARSGGTLATCAGHDLVGAIDLYGNPRGASSCSIGAVEADLANDVIRTVGARHIPWLLTLVLILLIIALVLGVILGARCRRRRKSKP
jgi:hypothetical protein